MELPGRGRRDLKRLLNENAVPGFIRGRLPLLYQGQQLLAVANLHGKPREPYNFGRWMISAVIEFALLIWGGFFK